ncbi:DUF5069 domain-containing protein [Coraliomargarita akajimensis]|uniref:DUF5069 domain-containing protein n=1 Tax=Coraliomargarita akajimensis (strain DSM 45221 / IAM 15411 / JCM 23193 / KCTC 12865 / 04OKA010-24) TaxID=583355 RepID=D5EK12_CORAD|nr:DUF5069 domain-containing protein [Coraliomargarita akajimensis]ADE54761.1 conserved hypothetical protein [Coraliomargarita akajimensis DSM 45221]
MDHYTYPKRLKAIWSDAVARYEAGHNTPANFFDAETVNELAEFGLNTMDVFDYAEDYVDGKDPDFETFLMICEARRDYFLTEQKGRLSNKRLDSSTLPAKTSEARGIVWLPRIIEKAKSKLRGELPSDTMYSCGGDRRFLKTNNIHAAEFLRVVWAYQEDYEKIYDWVEARSSAER